jgi:hypothetical protein
MKDKIIINKNKLTNWLKCHINLDDQAKLNSIISVTDYVQNNNFFIKLTFVFNKQEPIIIEKAQNQFIVDTALLQQFFENIIKEHNYLLDTEALNHLSNKYSINTLKALQEQEELKLKEQEELKLKEQEELKLKEQEELKAQLAEKEKFARKARVANCVAWCTGILGVGLAFASSVLLITGSAALIATAIVCAIVSYYYNQKSKNIRGFI